MYQYHVTKNDCETVVHAFVLPLPTSKTSFLTDLYPGDLVECSGPSISKETIIPTVEQVAGYHYLQYCVAACGKSQKKHSSSFK